MYFVCVDSNSNTFRYSPGEGCVFKHCYSSVVLIDLFFSNALLVIYFALIDVLTFFSDLLLICDDLDVTECHVTFVGDLLALSL